MPWSQHLAVDSSARASLEEALLAANGRGSRGLTALRRRDRAGCDGQTQRARVGVADDQGKQSEGKCGEGMAACGPVAAAGSALSLSPASRLLL